MAGGMRMSKAGNACKLDVDTPIIMPVIKSPNVQNIKEKRDSEKSLKS